MTMRCVSFAACAVNSPRYSGACGATRMARLLLKLAGKRLRRAFVGLDLVAGLHEGLRAALSHQQDATGMIDDQAGGDTDGSKEGGLTLRSLLARDTLNTEPILGGAHCQKQLVEVGPRRPARH